jgi:hypothetical protein
MVLAMSWQRVHAPTQRWLGRSVGSRIRGDSRHLLAHLVQYSLSDFYAFARPRPNQLAKTMPSASMISVKLFSW